MSRNQGFSYNFGLVRIQIRIWEVQKLTDPDPQHYRANFAIGPNQDFFNLKYVLFTVTGICWRILWSRRQFVLKN